MPFTVTQEFNKEEYRKYLDKKVAREVFGWKTTDFPNITAIALHTEEEDLQIPQDFCPTERLKDAWRVIQTLRYKGIYIDIESMTCSVTAFVTNDETKEKIILGIEQCESIEMVDIPYQICKVALQALTTLEPSKNFFR